MTAILALDQGTTSSRALVFDEAGAQLAMAQRELRQIFPRPGWVEHDPIEIWESQRDVAVQALAAAGLAAADVTALGITNQRETVVVRPRVRETTALGAAYLAGLAVGVFRDLDEIAARWQPERRFEPAAPPGWREEARARWADAVRGTLAARPG
jgi:glycerol kinase